MCSVIRYPGLASQWDSFVQQQRGWTPFHLSRWSSIIQSVLGHECEQLAALDERGNIEAVLPLVHVNSVLFGRFLMSMPFVNYGGPLGSAGAVAQVVNKGVQIAVDQHADLFELRSRHEHDLDLNVSHRKITVMTDLPVGDVDGLWKALRAKLRSQIRRPMKEGIDVRFGHDQLGPFYQVLAEHMRDLGTPVHSRAFFEAIASAFSEDEAWFGCAYLRDIPVACGLGFAWNGEFEMTWASSLIRYNSVAPNMLLYWRFIERACQRRLTAFNFGRCTPNTPTHRFKKQWNSRDESLWWYYFSNSTTASTPSPDDSRYSWGPRIWRRLPVALTSFLGPRIVRYIP